MVATSTLTLPDGRLLDVCEVGDPAGIPVLYLHGSPGSRLGALHGAAEAARLGVRLVAFSRPGYGGSTISPPGLAGSATDVAALADAVGLARFAVLGVSGGGPFALAAAATLPERVSRVGVVSGTAHWPSVEVASEADAAERGLLETAARGDLPRALLGLAALDAARYDGLLALDDEAMMDAFVAAIPSREAELFDPPARVIWAADLREALTTYDGVARDNLSWGLPWDVDLSAIVAPTHLWHGEQDLMVPVAHAHWVAERVPGAVLTLRPADGHGGALTRHWAEILSTLTSDLR